MHLSRNPRCSRHIATIPDDIMYEIFDKLDFYDRIIAGEVCRQWDKLLNAADVRHWVIHLRRAPIWTRQALRRSGLPSAESYTAKMNR